MARKRQTHRKQKRRHVKAAAKVATVVKKDVPMERHHRLPRSRGGTSSPENIIVLSQPVHRAWHYLFGNANAHEVARMISDVFIDPDYYFVAVPRHRPQRNKRRTRTYCTDCNCEVLKYLPSTRKE